MVPVGAINTLDWHVRLTFLCSSRFTEDGTPVPKHVGVWYLSQIAFWNAKFTAFDWMHSLVDVEYSQCPHVFSSCATFLSPIIDLFNGEAGGRSAYSLGYGLDERGSITRRQRSCSSPQFPHLFWAHTSYPGSTMALTWIWPFTSIWYSPSHSRTYGRPYVRECDGLYLHFPLCLLLLSIPTA